MRFNTYVDMVIAYNIPENHGLLPYLEKHPGYDRKRGITFCSSASGLPRNALLIRVKRQVKIGLFIAALAEYLVLLGLAQAEFALIYQGDWATELSQREVEALRGAAVSLSIDYISFFEGSFQVMAMPTSTTPKKIERVVNSVLAHAGI